jgi:hypothetical protein
VTAFEIEQEIEVEKKVIRLKTLNRQVDILIKRIDTRLLKNKADKLSLDEICKELDIINLDKEK